MKVKWECVKNDASDSLLLNSYISIDDTQRGPGRNLSSPGRAPRFDLCRTQCRRRTQMWFSIVVAKRGGPDLKLPACISPGDIPSSDNWNRYSRSASVWGQDHYNSIVNTKGVWRRGQDAEGNYYWGDSNYFSHQHHHHPRVKIKTKPSKL